jgi:hypothetical protein
MSTPRIARTTEGSRREFLRWTAAGASGLSAFGCSTDEPSSKALAPETQTFTAPLGVELYTVRGELGDKTEETLRRVAGIGYVEVEHNWTEVKQMLPLLNEFGLRPVSIAVDTAFVTDAYLAEQLDETAAEAKEAGADYFMFPALPEALRGDLDAYRKFSAQFDEAGAIAMKHDVLFCYHNHAFEFEPMVGTTPFDVMFERFDPAVAAFEVDVFWVTVAGHDPVEMLARLGSPAPLLHLRIWAWARMSVTTRACRTSSSWKSAMGLLISLRSSSKPPYRASSTTSSSKTTHRVIPSTVCARATSTCAH